MQVQPKRIDILQTLFSFYEGKPKQQQQVQAQVGTHLGHTQQSTEEVRASWHSQLDKTPEMGQSQTNIIFLSLTDSMVIRDKHFQGRPSR